MSKHYLYLHTITKSFTKICGWIDFVCFISKKSDNLFKKNNNKKTKFLTFSTCIHCCYTEVELLIKRWNGDVNTNYKISGRIRFNVYDFDRFTITNTIRFLLSLKIVVFFFALCETMIKFVDLYMRFVENKTNRCVIYLFTYKLDTLSLINIYKAHILNRFLSFYIFSVIFVFFRFKKLLGFF